MFKNYFITAIRNILRYRSFSILNILGLAIGMACSILLLMWAHYELHFDSNNEKLDRIYSMVQTQFYGDDASTIANMPGILALELVKDFPEFEKVANYTPWPDERLVIYKDKKLAESIFYADQDFLDIFTLPFVAGKPENALTDLYSIIISEEKASVYFGDTNPVGQKLNIENKYDAIVKGVFKNLPQNSSLQFDFIMPFELKKKESPFLLRWGNTYYIYTLLNPNTNVDLLNEKLKHYFKKHKGEDATSELFVFPYGKQHLYKLTGEPALMTMVRIFTIIAIMILLIACFNFMNLSTALAAKRAKEIGLRKVNGAKKGQLIRQFLGESMIYSIIAANFAIIIIILFLPAFNDLIGRELSIRTNSNVFWQILVSVTLVTGILAGMYPAFFLSRYNTLKVIKNEFNRGKKGLYLRKSLVVLQFSISLTLIIITGVISLQIYKMQHKNLGLDKENMVYIAMHRDLVKKTSEVKNRLLKNPNVLSATATSHLLTRDYVKRGGLNWEGKDPDSDVLITYLWADYDFIKSFKIEMAEGRFFSKKFAASDSFAVVINETLAKIISNENAEGKYVWRGDGNPKYKIIGVVKDFHFKPPWQAIEPLIIFSDRNGNLLNVRISGKKIPATLNQIKTVFEKVSSGYPVEPKFFDEAYDRLYSKFQQQRMIIVYFSLLATFISALGIFGLSTLLAQEKTKEIGIRKALGATTFGLMRIFSLKFAGWVLLSNLIAWPLAYYFSKKFLEDFAFRISMPWLIFLLASLGILLVALLSVSWQSYITARQNPVKSLRYE